MLVVSQKEDVDDVATQLSDVAQLPQNTTMEDLSILISSLEIVDSSSVVTNSNNDDKINNKNNTLTKLIGTTVTLDVWNKFTRYLHRKYTEKISKEVWQAEIDSAFLAVVNKFTSQEIKTTTSSTSLLFDGTTPRKDRLEKLGNIAYSFSQQDDFPYITIKTIREIIKNHVGKDERTRKKYFDCIKQYSTRVVNDYEYSQSYDVRRFSELIPNDVIRGEND